MKKNKTLILILGVVLAAAVVVGLIFGVKALSGSSATPEVKPSSGEPEGSGAAASTEKPADNSADPTAESGTEPTGGIEDTEEMKAAKTKEVYTVDDITADDTRWEETVATCGDYSLNNRGAQIYYTMQYFNFMNQYGSYAEMFGMDLSKPLSEQASFVGDLNWEQYFLMAGMEQFRQYAAAAGKATAEGYTLPEAEAQELEKNLADLPEEAKQYGYESADAYLQASFGPGVRFADFEDYLRTYFLAMSYENKLYMDYEVSEEQIKDYFTNHPDEFEGDSGDVANVNVRHILITPAKDDEGNTTEEDLAAAKTKAEELLAAWQNEPTEEYFAKLAEENTDDPGSKTTGGLYEEVYPGQMVQPFNDWCFDASRQPGDTGVVETSYGYHVMYFVKTTETYHWKTVAEQNLRSENMDEQLEALLADAPLTANYETIVLAPLPDLLQQEEQ